MSFGVSIWKWYLLKIIIIYYHHHHRCYLCIILKMNKLVVQFLKYPILAIGILFSNCALWITTGSLSIQFHYSQILIWFICVWFFEISDTMCLNVAFLIDALCVQNICFPSWQYNKNTWFSLHYIFHCFSLLLFYFMFRAHYLLCFFSIGNWFRCQNEMFFFLLWMKWNTKWWWYRRSEFFFNR